MIKSVSIKLLTFQLTLIQFNLQNKVLNFMLIITLITFFPLNVNILLNFKKCFGIDSNF